MFNDVTHYLKALGVIFAVATLLSVYVLLFTNIAPPIVFYIYILTGFVSLLVVSISLMLCRSCWKDLAIH